MVTINCKRLLMATLATMSETDTFDSHAVTHHQPNGCGRESSGLSKYHQRKHFEGHSDGSHCLRLPPFFSSAATMARPGCGDAYAGLADGNGDKESIEGNFEPPVYMLVSLVKTYILVALEL